MNHAISWNRLAVEAIVIVSSILLAFAIDAWWAERVERRDERVLLERLHAEFIAVIDRYDARTTERDIQEQGFNLLELIDDGQEKGLEEILVPTQMIGAITRAPTFEIDTPVLDGLVSSGRIELIRNTQILSLISAWERDLLDYTTLAERTRRNVDERLVPAMVVRGDIANSFVGRANFRSDTSISIRIDDELEGLIAQTWSSGARALFQLTSARNVAGELASVIEAEL